ncbi:MAG TPA: hypothetical protein P5335_11230 [Flavobacterium sp.]|nr:hypothetical protein [Flavobacterium sp.]HRZ75497.1 hypothetical protein [Flavobacterium sp.]
MKNVLILIFLSGIIFKTYSQEEQLFSEYKEYLIDSTEIKLLGNYGYFFSGQFEIIDSSYFHNIFGEENSLPLNHAYQYGGHLGINRNHLYIGLNCYFNWSKSSSDTISIKLNQTAYSINLGYNIIINRKILITPFLGIKYNKYRYRKSNFNNQITIDDYLKNPGYDLKLHEFSLPIGLNMNFNYRNWFSYGLQVSYINPFTHVSYLYSDNNRINNGNKKALGNVSFLIGFGIGVNHLYRIFKFGNNIDDNVGIYRKRIDENK